MSEFGKKIRDLSIAELEQRLNRLISLSLDSGGEEPPRLVRANSAFALLGALQHLKSGDFEERLAE